MRPSRTTLLLARGALRSSASRCFFLTSSFTSASSSFSIVIESRTFFIRAYGITRNYKRTTMVSHPKKGTASSPLHAGPRGSVVNGVTTTARESSSPSGTRHATQYWFGTPSPSFAPQGSRVSLRHTLNISPNGLGSEPWRGTSGREGARRLLVRDEDLASCLIVAGQREHGYGAPSHLS